MDIYDVIDEWDLDRSNLNFNWYSRTKISHLAEVISSLYPTSIPACIGRRHMSLYDSISVMENKKPISSIAIPLLCSEQVWLPDPLYSVLSFSSKGTWQKMPESKPNKFNGKPSPYMKWNNYWSTKISDRISLLNAVVPDLISRLIKVKPLVRSGHIHLYPWEPIIQDSLSDIESTVYELQSKTDVISQIRFQYPQKEYSIGARLGPLGISIASGFKNGLNAGQELWLGEASNVIYGGMLNTLLTKKLNADFMHSLKGDRLVHDFIRTGGSYNPSIENQVNINLPNLSKAVWEDIVPIKQNSELVDILVKALEDSKSMSPDNTDQAFKDKFKELENQLKSDLSLARLVKKQAINMAFGTITGSSSAYIAGEDTGVIACSGIAGSVLSFLGGLCTEYCSEERKSVKQKKELICNISNRL